MNGVKSEATSVAEIVESKVRTIALEEKVAILVPQSGGGVAVVSSRSLLKDYDSRPTRREGIPVFEGGDLFQVLVRLRYRIVERTVRWILEPHDMKRVFDVAFEAACEEARDKTVLPLFYGTPE